MEFILIPSPPNCSEPDIIACAPDKTLLYGSSKRLVKIKPTGNDQPNDIQVINAHSERITAVKLNRNWGSPNKYAVTASLDKVIKLWDFETLQEKMSHTKHSETAKEAIPIGVSFADENRIVSATSDGQIVVWNILANEHRVLNHVFESVKDTLTCFSVCPHEATRAAFGMKNGLVVIVDLRRIGKILATYRGHNSEITSMSWCPVPVNVFPINPINTVGEKKEEVSAHSSDIVESQTNLDVGSGADSSTIKTACVQGSTSETKPEGETPDIVKVETESKTEKPVPQIEAPRKDFLLATYARDGYIYIWQTLEEPPLATFFSIPQSKNQSKNNEAPSTDVYNVLCWATPQMLLSSTASGELLVWTMPKPEGPVRFYKKLHHHHRNPVTSIKVTPAYWDETNFLQNGSLTVWSAGEDGVLCQFDCDSKQLNTYYECLNFANCQFIVCPVNPFLVAIIHRRTIRVWNLRKTTNKIIQFSPTFDQFESDVTIVAWHPTDKNILAWGTAFGKICILTVSDKKLETKAEYNLKSTICRLQWGPEVLSWGAEARKLFVMARLKIIVLTIDRDYHLEHQADFMSVPEELFERPIWDRDDYSNELVTFSWSPDYSFMISIIASYEEKCLVYRYDYTRTYEWAILETAFGIRSIIWHPDAYAYRNGEKTTIYSRMFVAMMKCGIAFYIYHRKEDGKISFEFYESHLYSNKLRGLKWSPYSADHLTFVDEKGRAGVYDLKRKRVLQVYENPWYVPLVSVFWNPIDQDRIIVATSGHMVLSVKIMDCPKRVYVPVKKLYEEEEEKEDDKSKKKKTSLVNIFYTVKEENKVADLKKVLQWKLDGVPQPSIEKSSCDVLDVFGDNKFEKILQLNVSDFIQHDHYHKVNVMSLIQGNLHENIRNAIEEKRVNKWILSVAPTISPELWREACATYLEQLLEEHEPDAFEVITFQLALHQVEEATKYLCKRKMFPEAYILVKRKYGPGHEIVNTVLHQWAKYCSDEVCDYELAACCYIMLGMYGEAAYFLFRRTSVEVLEFASKLANLAENVDLQKAIEDKLEDIRNPLDLTKPAPYLGRAGEKLRIFTPKTPNESDVSEAEDTDSEGTVKIYQEQHIECSDSSSYATALNSLQGDDEVTLEEALSRIDVQVDDNLKVPEDSA